MPTDKCTGAATRAMGKNCSQCSYAKTESLPTVPASIAQPNEQSIIDFLKDLSGYSGPRAPGY